MLDLPIKNTFLHVSEGPACAPARRASSEPPTRGSQSCNGNDDREDRRGTRDAEMTAAPEDARQACTHLGCSSSSVKAKVQPGIPLSHIEGKLANDAGQLVAHQSSSSQGNGGQEHHAYAEPKARRPETDADTEHGAAAPAVPNEVVVRLLTGGGGVRAVWLVSTATFAGDEHKVASPEFSVDLPGCGPRLFRITLYALQRRTVFSFRDCDGLGRVELKCEEELPPGTGAVAVGVVVGAGERAQRQLVDHDFSRRRCCSVRGWAFREAANPGTWSLPVEVSLAFLAPSVSP